METNLEALDHSFMDCLRNGDLEEMLRLYPKIEESVKSMLPSTTMEGIHVIRVLYDLFGYAINATAVGEAVAVDFNAQDSRLVSVVLEGNTQMVPDAIKDISKSFSTSDLSGLEKCLPLEKRRMLTLADKIVAEILVSGSVEGQRFISALGYRSRIEGAPTICCLVAELEDIFMSIAVYYQRQRGSIQKQRANQIKLYIESNISSPNLCISVIALNFGISHSHISRIFKREFGETVLCCISRLRLEKAKVLLTTTDKTVAEIAVSVGYLSSQSFVRSFHSAMGMPPGDFRKASMSQIVKNAQNC